MNRQTILASIHHHLRESIAESGEVRPLHEIVPRVARDIRGIGSGREERELASRVIPIEQVSAFVDGQLTVAEVERVCEAALVDNSVLAELVGAVRAESVAAEKLPPLSDALSARLMVMQPRESMSDVSEADTVTSAEHDRRDPVVVPPPSITIVAAESDAGRMNTDQRRPIHPLAIAGAILAIAAAILLVVRLNANRTPDPRPEGNQVVENDSELPRVDGPELLPTGKEPDSSSVAVVPPAMPNLDANGTEASDDAIVSEPNSMVAKDDRPDAIDVGPTRTPHTDVVDPVTPSRPPPPKLASLRWKEITGLLASQERVIDDSSTQAAATWKSVAAGSYDASEQRLVSLRTLPLSRAEAQIEGGGRIVMAGDSSLLISRAGSRASAEIDLHHGSVALRDLPAGSVIHVRHGKRLIARMKWSEKSSAILQRVTTGLDVHIDRGTIEINDQPHQGDSVSVANDRTVLAIDRPKRLPNWVDRPTDAIGIPRNILAQIADTDNVMRTLNQRVSALANAPRLTLAEQRTLVTLTKWQAAMADVNLYRMAGSQLAPMRLAALQRLASMPKTDPRYARTWAAIDRVSQNKQRGGQIRRWCEMARRGIRPNASQLDQMLAGLAAPEVPMRALSDFVLRQFYANGPPFDPTWTGTQQQRAINVWRSRVGRSARGAAAATLAPNNGR